MPLLQRLRRAIPTVQQATLPLIFWALCCGVSALIILSWARGWTLSWQTLQLSFLYAVGAAIAFWPSAYLVRVFSTRRSIAWFIVFAILLALATLFVTASIFALQHRLYYAQWHNPPFSRIWFWQQFFTAGSAVYTYLVMGLRLYLPIAAIALVLTSWWVNRLAAPARD